MHIVLPGALAPSAAIADELAKRLPGTAPTLYAWMRVGSGRQVPFDPHEQGCTPFEAWQLEQAGFRAGSGQPLGAGLGPLLAGATAPSDEPVWVADLAHVALSTDGASMVPAEQLALTPAQGAALLDAARPLIEDSPFGATPLQPYRWRVQVPPELSLSNASPSAVLGEPLDAWWKQDAAARPWRRLVNEIQMTWHEHPANVERAGHGQPEINALWLYGGAAPWIRPAVGSPGAQVVENLHAAFLAEDWGGWLQALARVDAEILAPHADSARMPSEATTLTLLGRNRLATLTLRPPNRMLRWLPTREQPWRTWWSPPA